MAIDSTNAAGSAATQSASQAASARLTTDYQSFLKLLTAQIANQDPLEPMDSTTFVSQLAQLSQVEQTITTNATLEGIAAQLSAAGALSDIQLIGHEVTLATDRVELRGGTAEFEYQLEDEAQKVTARILAEDGTLLREIEGLAGSAGETHAVAWDGMDRDGLPVPDGTFRVQIEASDAEGDEVGAATYATTEVKELTFESGQPAMVLRNGAEAPSGQVIAIR
ncbi:hypothetical protein E0K89_013345 [Aquicoccus sp. SCR17]|nr:hypothetical protein [Carideicomes alvinocaridis]